MSTNKKEIKTVFVIMPFRMTPSRNKQQLTAFFNDQLKNKIEKARFKNKFVVTRSDESFNITEKIIQDIYNADYVICDLSGKESNPNVMYELGIRLALTDKPVILIREHNVDNRTIFDISGFYAQPYDPLNYDQLVRHIISKIKKFESGEEVYKSPVLDIISRDIPLLSQVSRRHAREQLRFMDLSLQQIRRLFIYSLIEYLNEKEIQFDLGDKFDSVAVKIYENIEEFNTLDFSDFRWQFSNQPIVDYYLANQYLNNIHDAEIVAPFTLYIISYHAHFLGSNVMYQEWTPTKLYQYLGETQLFINLINGVIRSLADDCTENTIKEIIKLSKAIIEDSQIQK